MVRINYARHLPIIGALILLELLVPGIYRAHYRLFSRPALLRAGAVECGNYHSPYLSAEELSMMARPDCDIVLPPATPGELAERYYARSGKETIVRYERDTAIRAEDSYLPSWILLACFVLGSLLCMAAIIRKALRTGSHFRLRPRHPNDEIETLLYMYGFSMGLASLCVMGVMMVM